MDIALTSAIGLKVSITHLILLTAPFHVFAPSIGLLAPSVRWRAIRAFSVGDISAWPSGIGVPVSMEGESGEVKRGSGAEDRMGPPESGTIEGLVVCSAGAWSPLVGISGRLLGKIEEGIFAHTLIVK